MRDGLHIGPVPQAARVLLRIEYADGQIREFEAQKPHGLECTIEHSLDRWPLTGDPLAFPPMEVTSVRLGFSANGDPRYPAALRTEAAGAECCVTCGADSLHWVPLHRAAR